MEKKKEELEIDAFYSELLLDQKEIDDAEDDDDIQELKKKLENMGE